MSRTSTVRRYAGLAGATVGVLTAGAAAGILAERKIVSGRRLESDQPLGSLRAPRRTVAADDGLELYAEVDEPETPKAPTLVFIHGYALNLDCWHFQRIAFRDTHSMVFYDQRSHGRSSRSPSEHCTFEQLGSDLARVVDELAPAGPLVLVGHSMGGITIMALAARHPDWFGDRVAGVCLMSTSAGELKAGTLGLPGFPGRLLTRVTPALVATMARVPRLVESGRRASSDFGFVLTRRLAFGGPVPQEYVDFTDEMLAATPFDVVADFFPAFEVHDKHEALAALSRLPVTVICGSKDAITPVSHSRRIAELLPDARFVQLADAGHMVILERHTEVDSEIVALLNRAQAGP